jgi:hypothetical protein
MADFVLNQSNKHWEDLPEKQETIQIHDQAKLQKTAPYQKAIDYHHMKRQLITIIQ